MAFFVIFCANGKDLGKFKNHAFANIAGVIIIVVTLFICYRNMTNFLTSLQASSACKLRKLSNARERPLFGAAFFVLGPVKCS